MNKLIAIHLYTSAIVLAENIWVNCKVNKWDLDFIKEDVSMFCRSVIRAVFYCICKIIKLLKT